MICNIMLDLETTGLDAGCCIISVALVPFLTDNPIEPFYETISHRSCLDAGFTDNHSTLAWWDRQKPEIAAEAFSGTRSIDSVLDSISFYLACIGEPKEIFMWGNGKDFDQPILTAAFRKLNKKLPWDYRNNKCYRDLTAMYPYMDKPENKTKHNALADAKAQAEHAQHIILEARRYGISPVFPR